MDLRVAAEVCQRRSKVEWSGKSQRIQVERETRVIAGNSSYLGPAFLCSVCRLYDFGYILNGDGRDGVQDGRSVVGVFDIECRPSSKRLAIDIARKRLLIEELERAGV